MRFCFLITIFYLNTLAHAGEWEYELDPYYSNVAYYQTLDQSPIPELGERSEAQVYSDLFFRSYFPQFFLLEVSVNPLPVLGVALKSEHAEGFYDDMNVTQQLNLVEVVTAGFEEPYALSLFLGNMVKYRAKQAVNASGASDTESKGFMGYLASYGHLHIRKNELIQDRWGEFEWKIKGDQITQGHVLSWSFRIGAKIHDNPFVTDEYYVALKRERVEEYGDIYSWVTNGGIEIKYRVSQRTGNTIGQQIIMDKKFPLASCDCVVSLGFGVVRQTREKYSGPLSLEHSSTAFVLRPSVSF